MTRVKKHPWSGMKGPKADFLKLVDELARHRSHREVFNDFLDAAFCAFTSPLTPAGERRDAIEGRYREVIGFDDRYSSRLPELLGIFAAGIDQEGDFLGPISGELAVLNAKQGQFFTPWPLCQLLAMQTICKDRIEACVEKDGFVTVLEPAVGSGALALAAAERIRELGFDPGIHLWITAVDVSLPCVKMAYLQLSLRGIAADLNHGDMLRAETWVSYPTRDRLLFAIHHGDRLKAYLADQRNRITSAKKPQAPQMDLFQEAAE